MKKKPGPQMGVPPRGPRCHMKFARKHMTTLEMPMPVNTSKRLVDNLFRGSRAGSQLQRHRLFPASRLFSHVFDAVHALPKEQIRRIVVPSNAHQERR